MNTKSLPSINPPFIYDIVGSFLRPTALKKARLDYSEGRITEQQLKKIEDEHIIALIDKEKKLGLQAVTDGEFRRRWWHLDFIEQLNGITKYSLGDITTFQNVQMNNAESYYITSKVSFNPNHSFLEDFLFLKEHAKDCVAKQTIPGPNMLYLGGAIFEPHYNKNPIYSTIEELENDIVKAYQDAINAFYCAGCRYLQLDDTAWGRLLDPSLELIISTYGLSADQLIQRCADVTRRSLAKKPDDMTVTFHFCRGNFKSSWIYEGGYDAIAEQLLAIEEFDGFFLEYDNERSGSFEPLRHIKNQKVVLGLITTKTPELEKRDNILNRIEQAKKYIPSQQICISPQCGFASTEDGNSLTEEEQWKKIKLLINVAKEL